MNAIELTGLMSVNASIVWLGIIASVLCSLYSIHIRQKLHESRVSSLMSQSPALTVLNHHRALSVYVVPTNLYRYNVTLVAFSDPVHA